MRASAQMGIALPPQIDSFSGRWVPDPCPLPSGSLGLWVSGPFPDTQTRSSLPLGFIGGGLKPKPGEDMSHQKSFITPIYFSLFNKTTYAGLGMTADPAQASSARD